MASRSQSLPSRRSREAHAKLRSTTRRFGNSEAARLWTSLTDWHRHPALALLELYGGRWEQEGFYRELKIDLRAAELIQSHTTETAAQEVAAFVLGYAMLVEQRIKAAATGGAGVADQLPADLCGDPRAVDDLCPDGGSAERGGETIGRPAGHGSDSGPID